MTTISSLSLSAPMRQSVQRLQNQLAQVQAEISSGAPADLGLTLGASTGTVLSLESETDQLDGYAASNDVASTRLGATDTALASLLSTARGVSADLVSTASTGGSTATLQATAQAALQSLSADLNTSVGGQYVFGGINTTQAPSSDYTASSTSAAKGAVDAAFQSAFGTGQTGSGAATVSAADLTTFLDSSAFAGIFSGDGAGTSRTASATTLRTAISPSQTIATSVSARSSAFDELSQGYAILHEFSGGSTLSSDAQAAAVSRATTLINAGIADLTNVQSGVGIAQAAISDANTQTSAQATLLKGSIGDMTSVDTYALSSQVTTLQNQLEASYSLTSRLQQLSLVNYLGPSS